MITVPESFVTNTKSNLSFSTNITLSAEDLNIIGAGTANSTHWYYLKIQNLNASKPVTITTSEENMTLEKLPITYVQNYDAFLITGKVFWNRTSGGNTESLINITYDDAPISAKPKTFIIGKSATMEYLQRFTFPNYQQDLYHQSFYATNDGHTIYELHIDPDISACGVLTTAGATYTLTADIINATASPYCFQIQADNITFDGGNHLVDGTDVSGGEGIQVLGADNATVRNVFISDTDHAIATQSSKNNRWINITISSSYTEGIYTGTSDTNNIFTNVTNELAYSGTSIKCYMDSAQNTTSSLNMGWFPLLTNTTATTQAYTAWYNGTSGGKNANGSVNASLHYWYNNNGYVPLNEPTIISSRVSPTTAYTNSTLLGYCNSTDPDNATLRYYYRWFLNSAVNATGTSINATNATEINVANITSDNLSKGQNWSLECIANDFTYNSSALNSSVLTISNSPPTTGTPTLSPATVYKNTTQITCTNTTSNDADGDAITFTYLWYRNSTTTGITAQNITNASFGKTDILLCQITPYDGTANGTAQNSSNLTISNSVPAITDARIYPTPTTIPTRDLLGYCTGLDADSDSIIYHYRWFVNDALNITGSTPAYAGGVERNVANISSGNLSVGQNWTLECMGNDGTANGTASNSTATEVVGFKNLAGGIIQNGNATYNLPIKWMVSQSVDEDGVCQYIIPAAYWANFSANTIVLFNNTGGNLGADPNNRTVEWNCTVSAQPYNLTFNITANTLSFSNSSWSQNTTAENNVTRQHIYYNVTAVNSGAFSITNADFPTACFDANTTCTIQNTTNLTALQTLIVRQYGYGDYISETEAPQTITQDASMQPFIYAANTTLYLNSTLISNNTINLSLNGVTWNFSYVNLTCYDSAQCNFMQNYTAMENKSKPLQVSTNLTITESTETIPTNPFLYGDGIWTNISDDLNLTISNIKFARVVPAAPYFAFFVCAGGTCTASDGTGWASETASVVSGEIRRDAGDSLSSIMFLIPFSSSAGGGGGTITPPGNETPDLCGEQQYVTCGASQLSCTCYAGVWSCPTCYVENTTLIYGGGGGVIIPGTGLTGFVENLTGNAVVATTFTCGLLIGDDFPSIPIQVRAFVNQARCEFDSLLQMRIDSIKLPLGALMFVVLLLLTLYYSNKPTARAKFLLLGALTILEGVYSIELIVGYASIFL